MSMSMENRQFGQLTDRQVSQFHHQVDVIKTARLNAETIRHRNEHWASRQNQPAMGK